MKEKIINWLRKNWFRVGLIIILVFFIIGLFYWFQIRPLKIYSKCDVEAKKEAIESLKTKAEMGGGNIYKEATAKGMYLKDDYSYDYMQCLRKNGINK